MRVLTFSTLFPNAIQPTHGIFVENRLRQLVRTGQVSAHVIAPVPWFPFRQKYFGKYADFANIPEIETRHGLMVHHPRYLLIPKVGMNVAPRLMFNSLRAMVAQVIEDHGPFDLIDAHYFYPDGVAAAHLARTFGLPLVITARGTDINLIPQYASPRAQILWAASQASGIITVAQALKDEIVKLAAPDALPHPEARPQVSLPPIRTLRNGVDLKAFHQADRTAVRQKLGLTKPTLLSVGHLVERKGHHLVIEALTKLNGVDLLIVGEGPERRALKQLVEANGLQHRVTFLGNLPHETLFEIYSAADALVLASSREGWPNVLLEAMACGTPVIATNVWGSGEVVGSPEAGLVIEERTSDALAIAARTLLADLPDRAATRTYSENFSWDETSQGQIDLFKEILDKKSSARKSSTRKSSTRKPQAGSARA